MKQEPMEAPEAEKLDDRSQWQFGRVPLIRYASRLALSMVAGLLLGGCATVRTLDAAKPGAPIIYSGTRLDWYSLNGGCCHVDRFGAQAPRHAALDLPASFVLDTILLPFALAAELGVGLGVSGGL